MPIRTIKPIRMYIQKALPLVYDESLSYYEVLSKVIDKVNEIINTDFDFGIKIADPIEWNITSQYPQYTLVIDADGTAYISAQPVPTGINIDNEEYWIPVFNYGTNINELREQIAYNAEESNTTGVDLDENDLVFWKGEIYRVLRDMSAGSAFIIGTNIEKYTVDEKINAEITARENADSALQEDIDAEVLARQNADGALQEDIDEEVLARQNAVGALQDDIDALSLAEPLNVLTIGVKNDGVTPCSDIINEYSVNHNLYFPDGIYLIDKPLELHNSIVGAIAPRMDGKGSVLKCGFSDHDYVVKYLEGTDGIGVEIRNIAIECMSIASGILYAPASTSYRPPVKITNVSVWHASQYGIDISPASRVSRIAWLLECSVTGGIDGGIGYHFNANATDSQLVMCTAMYIQRCIVNDAGGLCIIGGHFYTGRGNIENLDTYWNGSITVESTADIFATNLYVDTALQYWVQRSGTAVIGNLFMYNDGHYITYGATNQAVTVLRADQSTGAKIKVANMFYGGTQTGITLLGQAVFADNITVDSQSPTFRPSVIPPMVDGLPTKYRMWIGAGNYHVIAAISHQYNDGKVKLRIGRNNYQADVNFAKTGSTITVSKEAVSGFDPTPLWYKTTDNVTYIYTNNNTFWATVEVLCSSMNDANLRNTTAALNLGALTKWQGINQSDNTGLTAIS